MRNNRMPLLNKFLTQFNIIVNFPVENYYKVSILRLKRLMSMCCIYYCKASMT